jgi:gamma-glutamyl:cysteine ligase YbdK (ATP-grasp superfamily)
MEHKFDGSAYTIGIEEELMILDAESFELVNAIESMLEPASAGEIKPELMESVLEVSTDPCPNTAQAGEQPRARVPARELARRLLARIRDHCQDLGSLAELEAVEDLLERGNGAARQVVVYEANHDLREVMAEIVAATAG